jgi:hypothetical protein
MSMKKDVIAHHEAAKAHHEQAVMHHRSASTHYKTGKDYAHAAHQAFLANGHALRAYDQSKAASRLYAEQRQATPMPGAPPIGANCAERHAVAADLHEVAARHHNQAARHQLGRNIALAAEDAFRGEMLGRDALFHGDGAAVHHVEHYGMAGPVAEIV